MGFGQCELTTRLTYSNFSTHKRTWRNSISLHTQTFAQHVCQSKRCTHASKQQSKTCDTHSMCLLLRCTQHNQTSCVVNHISIAHSRLQPSKLPTQRKHPHSQHISTSYSATSQSTLGKQQQSTAYLGKLGQTVGKAKTCTHKQL